MSRGRCAGHSLGNSPRAQRLRDVEVGAARRKLVAERRAVSWGNVGTARMGRTEAAWPAQSAGFSIPLPGHLGCRAVSLWRKGLPVRACLPWLPPLSVHLLPAAHLPRGAGNPSAHPAESKIHERQIIRGRLSSSLPLAYGSARTWKYSFQVSLCIYVTQTNSFLERATLSHLDT